MVEEATIIDVLQETFELKEMTFHRVSPSALRFEYEGEWRSYVFDAIHISETVLVISAEYPVHILPTHRESTLSKLYELMNRFHRDVTTGTFCHDRTKDKQIDKVCWSHKILLVDDELSDMSGVEGILNEAFEEVDEFYPSFQYVLLPEISVEEAYNHAIPAAYGHA
jgi:hypothetical protein